MEKDIYMSVEDDEIDLGQIIRSIWSTRYTVIISVAIFIALFASTIFYKAAVPRALTYSQIINFTFNGAQERKFENGEPFRLEDMLAPAVVFQVHAKYDLDTYGFDLNRFGNSLSVTPYAPDLELIIEQYSPKEDAKVRLKSPAMLANEQEAREQLERELKLASSKSARISLIDKHGRLPAEVARSIVADIPKTWARISIEERGVMRPSVSLYTSAYLKRAVAQTENIENLQMLWSYLKVFQGQVNGLLKRFPSAANVVDEESGLTALDVSLLLKDAEKILVRIPEDWSARSDFETGLNEPLFSSQLFDQSLIKELDYQIILDILAQRMQLIYRALGSLGKYSYSSLATDPESGLAVTDLNRLLSDLDSYELQPIRAQLLQVGISKERETVPLYFDFRIRELLRRAEALESRSKIVQSAEARYVQGGSPLNSAGMNSNDGTVAQFSEGFLDRIMSLNTKGDDLEYRQELNRRSIQIEEQAVEIKKEIRELQEYQAILVGVGGQDEAQPSEGLLKLKAEILQRFEQFVPDALRRLQSYAEATQRIADRLFAAQELHTLFSESKFAMSGPGQYLKRTSKLGINFSELLNKVELYTQVVHSVVGKMYTDKVTETGDLYSLEGGVVARGEKIITLKKLILVMLGSALVGFFAMIGHLIYRAAKKKPSVEPQ